MKTYESIVKGENVPEPGIPESFKVLVKGTAGLALDVKVYSEEREEITASESTEDDTEELNVNIEGREDETAIVDFDDIGDELIEDDIVIDDFDIGDITNTTDDLDDSLGDGIFYEDEDEFVDNLDDEEF